jgi:hypothetical protein
MWAPVNFDPLSESIPAILKGNLAEIVLMAENICTRALFLHAAVISQEVAISTKFRFCIKSPDAIPPSWPTRSASIKPGFVSSQSVKVLMGMAFLRSVPGFIPFLPLPSL